MTKPQCKKLSFSFIKVIITGYFKKEKKFTHKKRKCKVHYYFISVPRGD